MENSITLNSLAEQAIQTYKYACFVGGKFLVGMDELTTTVQSKTINDYSVCTSLDVTIFLSSELKTAF